MNGSSLEQAKRAFAASVGALSPGDSFNVFAFESAVETWSERAVEVTSETLASAKAWVNALEAKGGTELLPALQVVHSASPKHTEVIVLTDGDVGVVGEVASFLRSSATRASIRTHFIGIGFAAAGDVLSQLARACGGTAAGVHPGERIEPAVLTLVGTLMNTRVDKLELNLGGKEGEVAAPVVGTLGATVTGLYRWEADPGTGVTLVGLVGNQKLDLGLEVVAPETEEAAPFFSALWANRRVSDLLDQTLDESTKAKRFKKLALSLAIEHRLLTTETSLILVGDRLAEQEGDTQTIEVPVLLPHGYGVVDAVEELRMAIPPMSAYAAKALRRHNSGLNYSIALESTIVEMSDWRTLRSPAESLDDQATEDNRLYELLALQLPKGGFGPTKEVLRLLGVGLTKWRKLLREKGLVSTVDQARMLTLFVLASLRHRWPESKSVWESIAAKTQLSTTSWADVSLMEFADRLAEELLNKA